MMCAARYSNNFIKITIVGVILTLSPVSTSAAAEDGGAKSGEASKAPIVMVEQPQLSEIFDEITYPARAVSRVNAAVQSDSDGIVVAVLQPLGKAVKVGTPLLKIKNTDPVYEYVPVIVTSPVAGVVSGLDVSIGTMVRRGQTVATITDPKQIRLNVEVTAADLRLVSTGLEGDFLPVATMAPQGSGLTHVKVQGVSPLVDPATGTATVELVPADAKTAGIAAGLMVGMVGRVTFKVNQRKGIQVPEQALVYRGTETLIKIVEGNKAKMVPVKVAATRRGIAEISTGVKAGDQVIVRSSMFVADGQEVTVQKSDVAKK